MGIAAIVQRIRIVNSKVGLIGVQHTKSCRIPIKSGWINTADYTVSPHAAGASTGCKVQKRLLGKCGCCEIKIKNEAKRPIAEKLIHVDLAVT